MEIRAEARDRRITVVTIDTSAMAPRGSFAAGDRVLIASDGLYAGETAIVERLAQGVIPAAVVRTEAGRTRRVRVIDLRPASAQAPTES
jgi:ABC-type sugar transport system substrate-binding protein